MEAVLDFIYSNILSILMMVLLIAVGLFLTIRTKAMQFSRFGYAMKNTVGSLFDKSQHVKDKGSVSPFQAVTTALAGTIGTGSIAGVATALFSGGPGAIFWMWISALLGMVTKYAEIVLSIKYREKKEDGSWAGGPMYYIKKGLKSPLLAIVFAIFAMIACIGTGNATQSNAISSVMDKTLQIPTWVTGLVLTVIVALVILGGVKSIASVNEKLVPTMAIFFLLICLVTLGINVTEIPSAFGLIFQEAFNFRAAFGGIAGYGVFSAMRFGVGRGVFTNEAGLGSAPIAHAASSTTDPVKQGLWGMFEVFITTIIICSMTALVVLTSDAYADIWGIATKEGVGALQEALKNNKVTTGAALSSSAFNEALPGIGEYGVAIATLFFSLSTILGWAYYGEVCAGYIFSKHRKVAVWVYRTIYVAFVFVGAVADIGVVWLVADCFNVLMALPNLIALVVLSGIIYKTTKEHFDKKNGKLPELGASLDNTVAK